MINKEKVSFESQTLVVRELTLSNICNNLAIDRTFPLSFEPFFSDTVIANLTLYGY